MQGTQKGAEALLRMRWVVENGDAEAFHAYRRAHRHRTVYGIEGTKGFPSRAPLPALSQRHGLDPLPSSAFLTA